MNKIHELNNQELQTELSSYEYFLIPLEREYSGNELNGCTRHLNWNTEKVELKQSTSEPFFQISQYVHCRNGRAEDNGRIGVFALEKYIPKHSIDFLIAKGFEIDSEKSLEEICAAMILAYKKCKAGNKIDSLELMTSSNSSKKVLLEPIFYGELTAKYSRYGLEFNAKELYSGDYVSHYKLGNLGCEFGKLRFLQMDGKSTI